MYLLFQVGGIIGVLPTIGCVMLTAVIGVSLLRWQGFNTLQRGMGRVSSGELPAQEIAEGMMLAFAGALLLTPGFFTDAVGFSLLVPAVRRLLVHLARTRLKFVTVQSMQGMGPGSAGGAGPDGSAPIDVGPRPQPGGREADGVTIEGEFERR